jgi:hypothetical protein
MPSQRFIGADVFCMNKRCVAGRTRSCGCWLASHSSLFTTLSPLHSSMRPLPSCCSQTFVVYGVRRGPTVQLSVPLRGKLFSPGVVPAVFKNAQYSVAAFWSTSKSIKTYALDTLPRSELGPSRPNTAGAQLEHSGGILATACIAITWISRFTQ